MIDRGQIIRDRVELVDGVLYWKRQPVVGCLNADGYRKFNAAGNTFLAHRVVWFLIHGEWPDGEIDHINSVRDDNRIENLRVCSRAQNTLNNKPRSKSRQAYKGISKSSSGKFFAAIQCGRKRHYLGSYATAEAAARAYDKAAVQLHGEFARLNFPDEVAA